MKKIIVVFIATFCFFSCERLFFDESVATKDPVENFNYLWDECNRKYSYFDVKNIDWDSVKTVYKAKINSNMGDEALFTQLGNMLSALRDDHTNLISDFNISRFGVRYLGQDNFDWRIVTENYIPQNYYITGPFRHSFLSFQVANKNIAYVRFGSFSGVTNSQLDFVLNKYKDAEGLILDIRENGGGYVDDVYSLLSRFVKDSTLVYYSRIKTGEAHNDFSDASPVYVYPDDGPKFLKKVAVLVDRGTYSAGSFTALATKALDSVFLVGDFTGGGLGLPNGGQLPNGWTYRFSVSQTLNLNKSPEYENGVPPDHKVLFNWDKRTKDEIIDKAIELLEE